VFRPVDNKCPEYPEFGIRTQLRVCGALVMKSVGVSKEAADVAASMRVVVITAIEAG
jgi:hypothetical protein